MNTELYNRFKTLVFTFNDEMKNRIFAGTYNMTPEDETITTFCEIDAPDTNTFDALPRAVSKLCEAHCVSMTPEGFESAKMFLAHAMRRLLEFEVYAFSE